MHTFANLTTLQTLSSDCDLRDVVGRHENIDASSRGRVVNIFSNTLITDSAIIKLLQRVIAIHRNESHRNRFDRATTLMSDCVHSACRQSSI